jgi:hypothetical protein
MSVSSEFDFFILCFIQISTYNFSVTKMIAQHAGEPTIATTHFNVCNFRELIERLFVMAR